MHSKITRLTAPQEKMDNPQRPSCGNLQHSKRLMVAHFAALPPAECASIGGTDDYILGPKHCQIIQQLSPKTPHISVPRLGHMINIEMPAAFEANFPGASQ